MGGKRNQVLGRCAALLFLSGAAASVPTNLLLSSGRGPWLVNALALVSAIVTVLVPWGRIDRRWLHLLVVVATGEVVLAIFVHKQHALVFGWFFVLTAVFAAYAFRRRAEALAQVGLTVAGMLGTAVYTHPDVPDAVVSAIVGVPTVCVAAAVVIWLRENLERRERTDPLTGLGNRRALMEALEEVIGGRQERLLALFDLDGFKRYNDRLGHAAGDALLQRLGFRLLHAVTRSGEAFRLGGDEFCVLLEDPAVLAECEAALSEDGILASHGTARLPEEADTISAALRLADDRMYAVKRGRGDVPFVLATEPATRSPSPSGSGSGTTSTSRRRQVR